MLTIPIPRDGRWTLDAYHALPEELPVPVDLVDGALRIMPKPTPLHNEIAFRLAVLIDQHVPDAWRVVPDVDVLLSDDEEAPTEVAPDVVVCSADHDRLTRPVPSTLVLLVAEVVSPGSTRKDRVEYPWRYAAAGIPYYWRIETPATSDELRISTYILHGDQYVPDGEFTTELEVSEPFPMAFAVDSLLR